MVQRLVDVLAELWVGILTLVAPPHEHEYANRDDDSESDTEADRGGQVTKIY